MKNKDFVEWKTRLNICGTRSLNPSLNVTGAIAKEIAIIMKIKKTRIITIIVKLVDGIWTIKFRK